MIRYVVAKVQVEGFHFWSDAPSPVSFLKFFHRHMFHIKMFKLVNHNDRDVEIILMKRQAEDLLRKHFGRPCNFEGRSCEDIAQFMIEIMDLSGCEVLEDNENGAYLWKST